MQFSTVGCRGGEGGPASLLHQCAVQVFCSWMWGRGGRSSLTLASVCSAGILQLNVGERREVQPHSCISVQCRYSAVGCGGGEGGLVSLLHQCAVQVFCSWMWGRGGRSSLILASVCSAGILQLMF